MDSITLTSKLKKSLEAVPTFKQWKEVYLPLRRALYGIETMDEQAMRNSYYELLVTNLNKKLVVNMGEAYAFYIKQKKIYRGFSDYIDTNTQYKTLLSLIVKSDTEKAEREYERIFASSPDLMFLQATNLAEIKQHEEAIELASRVLHQFKHDNRSKTNIHLLIAEQKAILKCPDGKDNIEAVCDLYFQEMDHIVEDKRDAFLYAKLFNLRTNEVVWASYQQFIEEKLCAKLSGIDIIVLYSMWDNPTTIFTDVLTPQAVKSKMDTYSKILSEEHHDAIRDVALLLNAEQLMWMSRYEDAILLYKESLSIAPSEAKWGLLANNQHLAGYYEDALGSISKALEYDPDNENDLHTKCMILRSLRRQKEALEIAKLLPKSTEDKLSRFEWSTLLEMGETSQIVERYANLEQNTLSGIDYIAWMLGLWYENKMNQANDIFVHLLDNMDSLPDKDDPFLLFFLVNIGSSFAYKISDLYDKYISSLLSQGEIIQLAYNPKALDVDLVDWLKRKDKLKELVEKVRSAKVPFDFKLKALCNIDPVAAREFLEEFGDLLDVIQYWKHDLRLSLLEGKTIEKDLEFDKLILELRDKDFDLLLNTAYEKERYDLVSGFLDIRPSTSPMYTWFKFLACTYLGETEKGRQSLESVDFDHLINTHKFSASDNLISIGDVKMSPIQVLESIDSLFPSRFPYHRIALENFITLLKKASDPSLYKPIDWAVESVLGTIKQQPGKLNMNTAYGDEYNDLMVKKTLMDRLSVLLTRQEQKNAYASQCLRNRIQESILERYTEIVYTVKREERNRIIANLSHSIKNMLKAVIGPLQTLREEIPEKAGIIDNAIKGANLIREIVNAINLSFNTSMDELNWDVLNPGRDSMSLQDMIADSLKYSIGNMFDFRYFPVYAENYFPRSLGKTDFEGITSDWNQAQGSIDKVKDFCNRYLFKLELDLDDSRDYHVGNEKSSAIKLMILFQEMIFNAVKYTSFIPFEERNVQISLTRHDDKLRLMVRNSYSEKVRAKTTGVGKLVIENFAKVLGCEPRINTENNSYSIEMEFADIWRKHAQDSVY